MMAYGCARVSVPIPEWTVALGVVVEEGDLDALKSTVCKGVVEVR
jgi:hypothetical protein